MADPGFFAPKSNRPWGSTGRVAWKRGDRVLAPWEPIFLYAGTLDQIEGTRAFIEFDDGDAGWVELAHVQPLALQQGQRVMSRRRMGPHFFPGAISEVDGEKVLVEFDDGKEEQTTVASLRIPCAPVGQGAEQVQVKSHIAFLEHLEEGDRVWALWNNTALFPGTVGERRGAEAAIQFDDGDHAWVRLEHMLPLDLMVGMLVMSRRRMSPEYHAAAITDTEGDRVQVRFEDGSEEWTTAAALVMPLAPFPAPGPPDPPAPAHAPDIAPDIRKINTGWSPTIVLAVGALVVAAVALIFFTLGRG